MASFQQYETKKDGKLWLYKIVIDGKHTTRRGFATKTEAKKHEAAFRTDLARGQAVAEVRKDTLGAFCQELLETRFIRDLRPSTLVRQRGFLKYIDKHLGRVKVQALKSQDIDKLYTTLLAGDEKNDVKPIGAGTVRGVGVFLSKCMDAAIDYGYITVNPCKRVKMPAYKPEKKEVWSADQFTHFLNSSKDSYLRPFYMLALLCGLRFGECTSLTWDDVDFDKMEIKVRKTVTRSKEGLSIQNETKTGRNRVVAMTNMLAHYLRQHKMATQKRNPLGLVVASVRGQLLHNASARNRFVIDVAAAHLPLINMHTMRHSHLTDLLLSGEALAVVSQRAGHSSANVTLSTYAHALPDSQAQLADRMEQRYKLNL